MKFASSMAGALLAFCSAQCWAQVSVFPPQPKAFETVRVQVPTGALLDQGGHGDYYDPADTTVSMAGNKITVSLLTTGNNGFQLMLSPKVDQPIGQLPPGTYEVEVVKRGQGQGSGGSQGKATFTVAAKDARAPLWDITDMWWVQQESGWGISIVKHPSDKLFVMLYVYDTDGKPLWYHVPDGTWQGAPERLGRTYSGALYKTRGSFFGGAYVPSELAVTPAGTARIMLNPYDYDVLDVSFVVEGVHFNRAVKRLSY